MVILIRTEVNFAHVSSDAIGTAALFSANQADIPSIKGFNLATQQFIQRGICSLYVQFPQRIGNGFLSSNVSLQVNFFPVQIIHMTGNLQRHRTRQRIYTEIFIIDTIPILVVLSDVAIDILPILEILVAGRAMVVFI